MVEQITQLTISLIAIFSLLVLIPTISRKLRLPVIVVELLFGIILGVTFLNLIPLNDPIVIFFSSFGLTYLLFLAGLEIDVSQIRKAMTNTAIIATASLTLPFIAGIFLAPVIGAHPLLLGTIFSTTSVSVVLPLVKEFDHSESFNNLVLGSVILVEVVSLLLLGFSISFLQGDIGISFLYSILALILLFLLPPLINRTGIQQHVGNWLQQEGHFEMEVRFAFALIFILAAVSGQLGFHSIVGAFIAGLLISETTPNTSQLEEKLEGFGYGFFIPLFFIFTGAKADLTLIFSTLTNIGHLLLLTTTAILINVGGVSIASRLIGFTTKESLSLGFFHAILLSLTVAAAEITSRAGLIGSETFSLFITLAIASAIICPVATRLLLHKS